MATTSATRKATARKATAKAAPKKATARKATAKAAPKKATESAITAPKGGDRLTVREGAVAKAIKASGKSIAALASEHGLNPSQLRRMSKDEVAKVDTARAEAIAKALGAKVETLFAKQA